MDIRWLPKSPYLQLTLYYLVVAAAIFGLISAFPTLESAFTMERLAALPSEFGGGPVGVEATQPRDPIETGIQAITAILGALLVLAPVAWVYMLTKQEKGYDESVVHTVLILPVPVTGLVIVIVNSLALAFALAGIVAAVRFRNTLDDTKDAVYIFLAIGTALAAGAQALGVALSTPTPSRAAPPRCGWETCSPAWGAHPAPGWATSPSATPANWRR
jgi:hypothetical protein